MDDGGDTSGMKVLNTWNNNNSYYDQLQLSFFTNQEIQQSPILIVLANYWTTKNDKKSTN